MLQWESDNYITELLIKKNIICDALRDLVPFVQFKKREKYPWISVTFSAKSNTHSCVFSRFLNCTNGTKLRNAPHLILCIAEIES